jgi:cyclin-dependent kinase 10
LPEQPYNFLEINFPKLSAAGVNLLDVLLTFDPEKRGTATEALAHPFFQESPPPKPPAEMPTYPSTHSAPERGAERRNAKRSRGALDERIGAVF